MAINFLAALQQEAQNIEKKNAGRDRDEAPRTKNPILRLGGKNKVTELKLRILPSVQMIQGEPGALLGVTTVNLLRREGPKQNVSKLSYCLATNLWCHKRSGTKDCRMDKW